MKVKIDEKLICIPPYISATWDQVSFLQSEEDEQSKNFTLIIHLKSGKVVKIPELDAALVDLAFTAHMNHLEGSATKTSSKNQRGGSLGDVLQQLTGGAIPENLAGFPIRLGMISPSNLEGVEMAFQHNQAMADSPDMPPDVLEKVAGVTKMLTGNENLPKPEPHCNCMFCQIARAIHGIPKQNPTELEDLVSEEDLKFRNWDIQKQGDKLYRVANPLDKDEHYQVYLGTPVGCTCGLPNCEHIKAVLYSDI